MEGIPPTLGALQILDGDMPHYVHDNTDDEINHAAFLKAYVESRARKRSTSAALLPCQAVKQLEQTKPSDG
jgi:hypothetical protein